jgi:hypothetical protein
MPRFIRRQERKSSIFEREDEKDILLSLILRAARGEAVHMHQHQQRLATEGGAILGEACSRAKEGTGRNPGNRYLQNVPPYIKNSV